MQSSAGFGQSVPVQLCAEQSSNLQEKIKKKSPTQSLQGVLRCSALGVLGWHCHFPECAGFRGGGEVSSSRYR